MAMARSEIEKFNGKNDFSLWQVKMLALLRHQGLDDALEPSKFEDNPTAKQEEILKKAMSGIFLNLDDRVLREVKMEKSTASVWKRLEEVYMTKSFANKLYLKQRLYFFKFTDERAIGDQLDQFNGILDDLENVDAKLDEEDKAITLLNALPKSFEHLKDAMLYGRKDAITIFEVQSALKSKDLQKSEYAQESPGEALIAKKGKQKAKHKFPVPKFQSQKPKEKDEKKETRAHHYCKKLGYLKQNCYSWKRKQEEESQGQGSSDVVQETEVFQALNLMDTETGGNGLLTQAVASTSAHTGNGSKTLGQLRILCY